MTEEKKTSPFLPFYDRPNVKMETIQVAEGIPFGMESVYSSDLGLGGAYAAWGNCYDNNALPGFVSERLGEPVSADDVMNLADLGFIYRHHIPDLSTDDHLTLELEVGSRLLKQAALANGWEPSDVDGVLIGMSGPVSTDYVTRICELAGIPGDALKVSIHKACDGSMGALHLALNPELSPVGQINVAEHLRGKKVLVGGIEGLSRFTCHARDKNALQLFGNGAGVIGVIPGETMKFLVGRSFANYDEDGLLEVRMYYPHSGERNSLVEVSQDAPSHVRVAGLMHEPEDGTPIVMAGLMGMVKLFVRTGVQVVSDVYRDYQSMMSRLGLDKSISLAIVHHANYKINLLKAKQLLKEGIQFSMPWSINDFGNVSAASNMIAFLRNLPAIKPGDHVLFDGFGAGTYYDVMAVSFG